MDSLRAGLLLFILTTTALQIGCGLGDSPSSPGAAQPPSQRDPQELRQRIQDIDLVQITTLMNSLQRIGAVSDRTFAVHWQPQEAIEALERSTGSMPGEEIPSMEEIFGDHTMVFVSDMSRMFDSEMEPISKDELRARIRVRGTDGTYHSPLTDEEFSNELREMVALSMGGMPATPDMPEMPDIPAEVEEAIRGIHQFIFPRVADPTGEGTFTVLIDDVEFVWELPIAALLPPMVNPETGQGFPGNYRFDPETGAPLAPTER